MYTGLTGKVKIGKGTAAEIAYISNWSVEDTTDIIEVLALGDAFKTKKPGPQSWSASAEGAVEFADTNGHKSLFEAKHNGSLVSVELYLKDGGTSATDNTYFSGEGYIESLSVDLSAEDKGNISISINGTGELKLHHGATVIARDDTRSDNN